MATRYATPFSKGDDGLGADRDSADLRFDEAQLRFVRHFLSVTERLSRPQSLSTTEATKDPRLCRGHRQGHVAGCWLGFHAAAAMRASTLNVNNKSFIRTRTVRLNRGSNSNWAGAIECHHMGWRDREFNVESGPVLYTSSCITLGPFQKVFRKQWWYTLKSS